MCVGKTLCLRHDVLQQSYRFVGCAPCFRDIVTWTFATAITESTIPARTWGYRHERTALGADWFACFASAWKAALRWKQVAMVAMCGRCCKHHCSQFPDPVSRAFITVASSIRAVDFRSLDHMNADV